LVNGNYFVIALVNGTSIEVLYLRKKNQGTRYKRGTRPQKNPAHL